jgi:hypothetical protein
MIVDKRERELECIKIPIWKQTCINLRPKCGLADSMPCDFQVAGLVLSTPFLAFLYPRRFLLDKFAFLTLKAIICLLQYLTPPFLLIANQEIGAHAYDNLGTPHQKGPQAMAIHSME